MDNPAILLLWLIGVMVGIWLALRFFKRPKGQAPVRAAGFGDAVSSLGASVRRALSSGIDEAAWSDLEETLLTSDLGVGTTDRVLESVRGRRPMTEEEAIVALKETLLAEFVSVPRDLTLAGSPSVVLVVGVNGTGKTTTIGKLGMWLMSQGKSVVLGAADTFRAGAGNQLKVWGERLTTRVVAGEEGADPASVAFDAVEAARSSGIDVAIIDTAGRLHGKKNLMEELAKINRVAGGEDGVAEILLVLDATAGQNGLAQVREFADAVPVTGIVLTKLDGTARGGIVVAVEKELGVPVKFVGVGERVNDLVAFDPEEFVDALLGAA